MHSVKKRQAHTHSVEKRQAHTHSVKKRNTHTQTTTHTKVHLVHLLSIILCLRHTAAGGHGLATGRYHGKAMCFTLSFKYDKDKERQVFCSSEFHMTGTWCWQDCSPVLFRLTHGIVGSFWEEEQRDLEGATGFWLTHWFVSPWPGYHCRMLDFLRPSESALA